MNLALFDFDGTLTQKDSLPDFIKFAAGKPNYYLGLLLLSPILLAYKSGLIRNDIAKQKLIGHYFKGWPVEQYQQIAQKYSLTEIDKIIRQQALERLQWHQQQGDRVIVVSASMEDWLKPWCVNRGVELVATKLGSENGILTSWFETPNCHGLEKVFRIKEFVNLSEFECIYAYGDSRGDREMLDLADQGFYRRFN